ncbi:MAG: ATP-binding cassette domain-containing protein [Anaerolineae bacterium]|jgi:ABC-2 type transport system ATP-binding protein
MNSKRALEVHGISKSFATVQAVDDLSFDVRPGEIFGLLGPNGAGKTTSIRMALDIIKPDSGEIRVLGGPMTESKKALIGYLPEERGLYDDMTLLDTLRFFGQLKEMSRRQAEQQAETYLRQVRLWDARDQKIEALSRGMNQKAQFVAATMHEPDLIIVDEPLSGLDPVNTRIIKDLLYRMRDRGAAIIMSTHQMHQVEEMCQRILLIDRGQRVLYGPLAKIRRQFTHNSVEVAVRGTLDEVAGVERIVAHNGRYRLLLEQGVQPENLLKTLVDRPDLTVEAFEQVETSLEEIFVQVVGRELEPEEMPGQEIFGEKVA